MSVNQIIHKNYNDNSSNKNLLNDISIQPELDIDKPNDAIKTKLNILLSNVSESPNNEVKENNKLVSLDAKVEIIVSNDTMINDICKTHLYIVQQTMDNLVMSPEHYLNIATDSALLLVEQLHKFKPYYRLLQQLDKKYKDICDMKIDGIEFYCNKDIMIKEHTIKERAIANIKLNVFPEYVYNNIIKMYNMYQDDKLKFNIPTNEIMQRYSEIDQLYKNEEIKLYNCIDDFNQKMSLYILVNNKHKMKSTFIKNITSSD